MKYVLNLAVFLLTISTLSARGRQTTLFLAGDESMACPTATAIVGQEGWGEALKDCFDEKLRIDNRAQSHCGSSSFLTRHHWDSLLTQVKKGDVVLIQFGRHEKDTALYRYNMLRMVHDVRQKKAIAVLATPIRGDKDDGTERYANTMRPLEKELEIAVIDLWKLSTEAQRKGGDEHVQSLFISSQKDNGGVLLTKAGAWATANLAAQAFSKTKIKPLKKHLLSKKARQAKHHTTAE